MSTSSDTLWASSKDALWAVIGTTPQSAAELAAAASISASRTRKILKQWVSDGSVTHTTDPHTPRAAAQWAITTTHPDNSTDTNEPVPEQQHPDDPTAAPATTDYTTSIEAVSELPAVSEELDTAATPVFPGPHPEQESTDGGSGQGKLAPGALRGLVEDHLRDHPEHEFTPHQIGKALHGRSAGAVHNALVTLTKTGVAHQTCQRPKKFALTPTRTTS